MNVAVVVPRRSDGGRRDELWTWCRHWWEINFPDLPIVEGHHEGGRFNRSIAVNRAAVAAGDWDVLVVLDADVVLHRPAQLHRAISLAASRGRLTFAHDNWCGLSQKGTATVTASEFGPSHNWERYLEKRNPFTFSCCFAIPRGLWEAVGGMDVRFEGWGWEDIALERSLRAFGGGTERVHGDLFHMWHPRSTEREHGHPAYQANRDLGSRYKQHVGDRAEIAAILSEPGGPLATDWRAS